MYRDISIHAPPRGATTRHSAGRWCRHFNSRPSARGDCLVAINFAKPRNFNSRPSARGDSFGAISAIVCKFQFTPLREGRPYCDDEMKYVFLISIHAPPRGATVHGVCWGYWNLISIHAPPRGATVRLIHQSGLRLFQFTPLREGRPGIFFHHIGKGSQFQFTPLREGRHNVRVTGRTIHNFNSRPSARGDLSPRVSSQFC